MSRALCKHWCFTLNNPTTNDEDQLDTDLVDYVVVGEEVGENGTPHFQGYVCFKKKYLFTSVKKLLPRAHWEPMKTNPQKASDYCKKDGAFHEFGSLPIGGGQRVAKNWDEARTLARTNRLDDIDSSIYVPHYGSLKRIASDHCVKVPSLDRLTNEWHFGPTGLGKSRTVRTKYPDAFIKDANQWWDGYSGEEVVIIEDLDVYNISLGRYIKLWGDHYSFPADMKHQGKKDIRPKRFIITSNYKPSEIWIDERTYGPIQRRFRLIEYISTEK